MCFRCLKVQVFFFAVVNFGFFLVRNYGSKVACFSVPLDEKNDVLRFFRLDKRKSNKFWVIAGVFGMSRNRRWATV